MKRKRHRGDGTVTRLPSGLWQAKISAGKDATGRRVRESASFDTEAKARAWLRSKGAERDRGELVATPTGLVNDWLREWLSETEATTEPRTAKEYRSCLEKHVIPFFESITLRDLTGDTVAKWRDKLLKSGRSPSRAARAMHYFSIAMNAAAKRGRIPRNPVAQVKKPKGGRKTKEVDVFTREEVAAILAHLRGGRYEALVTTWLDTGCRSGEMFGLKWADIDTKAGTIHIRRSVEQIDYQFREKQPKTAAGVRKLSISPYTVDLLLSHVGQLEAAGLGVGPDDLVFPASNGEYQGVGNFARFWRGMLKSIKISQKKPYALRHTCASLLLSAGVSLKAVQKRLGHENALLTLQTYAHLMPEDETKTVQVMQELFNGPQSANGPRKKVQDAKKP